jgi:hypothetical protein
VFCRSVLKVSKVLCTSSVIVWGKVHEIIPVLTRYCYIHEFNQLFRSKIRNYRRCSGCRSHDGRDSFLDHPRACFLETRKLSPPCLGHLLLESLLEYPPLCLWQILHRHLDRVVRPNLSPGSTILRVHHGFNKST